MDVTGISRAAAVGHTPAPVVPLDKRAETREVVQAVKALNGVEMFGSENELRFLQDPQTQRIVVRLINRKTSEVVNQVPAEYVLRLADGRKRLPER